MVVLLTGATGLLGSHVAVSLLQAGHHVIALARPKASDPADTRVRQILAAYPGWNGGAADAFRNLDVLEGDVLQAVCGVADVDAARLAGSVEAVIHCAGEVVFSTSANGRPLATNTDGVRNLVELTRCLGCRRLLHVSTAYVDRGLRGEPVRTDYERTKLEGERIVAEAEREQGLDVSIIRPSIVAGDQAYGFTPSFNGMYPFLWYAVKFWPVLRNRPHDQWLPDRMSVEGAVNILPGDYVASVILGVLEKGSGIREVNIINPDPWFIRDMVDIASVYLEKEGASALSAKRKRRETVSEAAQERAARTLVNVYEPYLKASPELDSFGLQELASRARLSDLHTSPDWIRALLRWSLFCDWRGIRRPAG